jgi:hypothetical protein
MGQILPALRTGLLPGVLTVALVDLPTGHVIAHTAASGRPQIDVEVVAEGVAALVRAERAALEALNLAEPLEELVVSFPGQIHIVRLLPDGRCLYLVAERDTINPALASFKLREIEALLTAPP